MDQQVDSYRFLSGFTKQMVKSWVRMETGREIPWTPLVKPLAESKLALISSAGIALQSDRPFDQQGERQNPWWGDPSYRVIPGNATAKDIRVYHLHVNPDNAQTDLNCIIQLERLAELAAAGETGDTAASHYSFMGYILKPETLLEKSVPAIIDGLRSENVDVVILVPV
ncbi:MAG: glycine/sarcosine/betaine reductase selenoprotein B family protein [Anaerolineaceae bacterium]|nr:glycine/sarcosine/betaine reductase selenoprotein B family protein [Anaerolineaceae bacterium]